MTGFVKNALLPKDLHLVFRTANTSWKFIKWMDTFDRNILSYIINNEVATPLLCVEKGESGREGSYFTLLFIFGSAIKQNEGNYEKRNTCKS